MNRTTDGRFISPRMKLPKRIAEKLILQYKHRRKLTWQQLAAKFGVSECMVRHDWRQGGVTIPQPIFSALVRFSKHKIRKDWPTLPPFWGQKQENMKKYTPTPPSFKSIEWAELYGAMLGDGCVYSSLNTVCITCNKILDKHYVEKRLLPLCSSLFGLIPKIYFRKREKTVCLVINNTKVASYFISQGFPIGLKKRARLEIPELFFGNSARLASCLRGIFDTDGGVYSHPHTGIMLDISSANQTLLSSIMKASTVLNIGFGRTKGAVQIYGDRKVRKFFEVIGSNNHRNALKAYIFWQTGRVQTILKKATLLKIQQNFSLPYHGPVV